VSGVPLLIADDDPSEIERLQVILIRAKILNPIQGSDSAVETIRYLSGDNQYADRQKYPFPGIVFLDLIMAGKGGLDVVRWVKSRAEPQFKTLAMIVMTGLGNVEEIRQAYQVGAHSFLIKPLRYEDVLNLLEGHMGIRIVPSVDGGVLHFDSHYFLRRN
jgi:FixJ family two-component response regulator